MANQISAEAGALAKGQQAVQDVQNGIKSEISRVRFPIGITDEGRTGIWRRHWNGDYGDWPGPPHALWRSPRVWA